MHNGKSHEQIIDGLLTKVGYGRFQKKLLILCGFGWLADNMWLQAVAIILPRVQEHFSISDKWIGVLSSSLFTGMMGGAFFWGTYSDARGRKTPYTMTLAITSFFGILSSASFSFWSLCLMLFFVGFGVGGNMPTDGALYLEFLPKEQHYLLTFMSVFFSFGAVTASIIGYIILPSTSCPEPTADTMIPDCDLANQNYGWRLVLLTIGVLTLLMSFVRTFWLKLPETPKFLMSQYRTKETIIVLENIARINGEDVRITARDLPARPVSQPQSIPEEEQAFLDEDGDDVISAAESLSPASESLSNNWRQLFVPKWRRTTLLVFGIWTLTSMAYTMFNVFLPKYLETLGFEKTPSSRKSVYWDYMVYSIAGVPGSLVASYMIETRLGRKGTMALSAFGSAFALFIFSIIDSHLTMVLSSSTVSFLATLLYAVIYGYTPEVFDTSVRGTAVGTASGLGRIAGILSPLASGWLYTFWVTLPLHISVVGFGLVGLCVVLLPFETRATRT
ncbi:major facilitator superfamily domain-containing protein [Phycomyces blakesleeanus]|uniref:Major facilitator superfamily domain-containing protein n=1 Tax=Phycomyces blakesleeanus TaxID=4837 RepID=A0ABR3B0S6_PHYBL